MSISTVDYSSQFKPLILDLFKKVFQKEMSEKFWNWRFEKNPYGKPIIKLVFYEETLIANYLLHPLEMVWGKKFLRPLFSMTTMIDPEFSRKGIMTNLASEVYQLAKSMNFDFVFAFVNNNSRSLFKNKLGFKELQSVLGLSYNLNQNLHLDSNSICEKIEFFDDSFSNFYDEQTNNLNYFIVPRTKEYLNWRYIQHPEISYSCYKITLSDILQGFFVLKIHEGKTCHIVDFYIKNSEDSFKSMISTTISFSHKHDVHHLTLWINRKLSLFSFLKKIGFEEYVQPTYFVVKSLHENKFDEQLFNYDNWYITMGNSDVY